jgi:hypothetical protein
MPIRHSREARTGGGARRGLGGGRRPGEARRAWLRWGAILALLALVLAASLAPPGQARGAAERAQREEAAASRRLEREERAAARRAQREAARAARQGRREQSSDGTAGAKRGPAGGKDMANKDGTVVTVSCDQITWEFTGFPNRPNNDVSETVTIRDRRPALKLPGGFSFDGPTGKQTTAIVPLPGHYLVDAQAHWNTNGHKGGFDIHIPKDCPPDPKLSIEKLQKIGGGYTTATLAGAVGEIVDYKIAVENEGNVPLTLGAFSDPRCDAGTISEPPSTTLAVGASASYLCSHRLTSEDQLTGSYANTAMVTGTPPAAVGAPITHTSNTVIVTVPDVPPLVPGPAFSIEKLQRISGAYTIATLMGSVGETVGYKIVVKNEGNVPLTLGAFSDPHCDPGTISAPSATLAVGASASYTCSHLLTSKDQEAESLLNTAALTATPPAGDGAPISHTSNTIVVSIPAAKGTHPPSKNTGTGTGSEGSPPASTSVSGSPAAGVLGFAAVGVPTLSGPQGCVRSSFHVSIKATGVQSVTYYLDGHKLKTLTAKNAHKGRLSIVIDPAKLKLGPHRLVAKITMAPTASAKARQASRTITVLRCRSAVGTPKFTG